MYLRCVNVVKIKSYKIIKFGLLYDSDSKMDRELNLEQKS